MLPRTCTLSEFWKRSFSLDCPSGLPATGYCIPNHRAIFGAALVVSWRNAHYSAEYHPEVTLIAKSHLLADLRDGLVRFGKQHLGLGDAEVVEVGDERLPGHLFEEAHKVRLTHANQQRRLLHRDRLAVTAADVLEQRRQPLQIAVLPQVDVLAASECRIMIHQQHQDHLEIGLQPTRDCR